MPYSSVTQESIPFPFYHQSKDMFRTGELQLNIHKSIKIDFFILIKKFLFFSFFVFFFFSSSLFFFFFWLVGQKNEEEEKTRRIPGRQTKNTIK